MQKLTVQFQNESKVAKMRVMLLLHAPSGYQGLLCGEVSLSPFARKSRRHWEITEAKAVLP